MKFLHDPFCRGVLSDVPTFLELVRYLTAQDAELNGIINLLDMDSFRRVPGDYSDAGAYGYADLAFLADVRSELLKDETQPVQVCVGFMVEHKSAPDNGVLEQLRRYNFHLMVERLKDNVNRGIPSVGIILYNGVDNWNPLDMLYAKSPKELQRLLLPFKCIMLDVKSVPDEALNGFGPRLAAFITALKYVRNPERSRELLRKVLQRIRNSLPATEALDLLRQMDVYLLGWISHNYSEVLRMDFIRPDYKTIGDEYYEAGTKGQAEETARRMLADGKPMDEIIRYSCLSEERIRELIA